jgi:hypothetical protein
MRATILAVLALSLHSGCGAYTYCQQVTPLAGPVEGPEVEGSPVALRGNGRPTLLVRYQYEGKYADEVRALFPKLRTFYASGLFASVVHQIGTNGYEAATDLTLDVTLREDVELHWYQAFGLLTLTGLPLPCTEEHSISAKLRDSTHAQIGEEDRSERFTTVVWMPLLPFSIIAMVTGARSAFDHAGREKMISDGVENMASSVLASLRQAGLLDRAAERAAEPAPKK